MAKSREGKRNKKQEEINSKAVSIYQERMIRFFDYLIEHNAKISVEIPSDIRGETARITYSKDHPRFNYRELLGEALGIDTIEEPHKIDEFFKDSYLLKREHSNQKRIRAAKKNVINNIQYEFVNDEPMSDLFKGYGNSTNATTRKELFIHRNLPLHTRTSVINIYPQILKELRNQIFGSFKFKENPFYPKFNSATHLSPFSRLYFKASIDLDRNLSIESREKLIELTEQYKIASITEVGKKLSPDRLLPDYGGLDIPFDICARTNPDKSFIKRGPFGRPINFDYEYSRIFEDKESWFDGFRYQKIKLAEEKLLSQKVTDWPPYVIEHIILTQIEFTTIVTHLMDTVNNELNNIHFKIFTGDRQGILDVQHDCFSLDELAGLLKRFCLEGNLDDIFIINGGSIINTPIHRFPNQQIADSLFSREEISRKIEEKLRAYFFEKISKNLCFTYSNTMFHPIPQEIVFE